MVNITCYGGVAEIGGNKILIEDGSSRIFLDFGKSFSREKLYFEEPFLSPREIDHLRALDLIPRLDGIYIDDKARYSLDGVLISHAHMDHYDSARMLKEEYPIYSGSLTKKLILTREWSTRENRLGCFGRCTSTTGKEETRNMIPLSLGKPEKIGEITATLYGVDHSVPGATGTILETSQGNIVYTGDIRFHGTIGDDTERFVEKAAESVPELLLIEATHINDSKVESEEEVQEKIKRTIERVEGLVIAGFSFADSQRLQTFQAVAREMEMSLVISARQAFLAKELYSIDPEKSIDLSDPQIEIFFRKKQRHMEYEKILMDEHSSKIVTAYDLREDHSSKMLVASLYDMNEIAKIKPKVGSVYIHSASEPFEEEMEISYEKLHNWLEHLGIPLVQIHASGHANPFDLKEMIRRIAPKKVVPIHTSAPKLFEKFVSDLGIDVKLPEKDVTFSI